MYGKHFASMYNGSMVGSGAVVFAVWGYVISNTRPDRKLGGYIELNSVLLAAIIGEPEEAILEAIEFLCAPDPRTRTPGMDGRRMVKLGPYDYQVVNWEHYRAIRDEETRREQNRLAQERFRARNQAKLARRKGGPLGGELAYEKAVRNGDMKEAKRIEDAHVSMAKGVEVKGEKPGKQT